MATHRGNSDSRTGGRGRRLVALSAAALLGLTLVGLSAASASGAVAPRTIRVSVRSSGLQAHGASSVPSISGDGRFVAFVSQATDLVPGDTNGTLDVFVHDSSTGRTRRVSVSSTGGQADRHSVQAAISADGRYVAFLSYATNLVPGDTNNAGDVFVRDRVLGQTRRVNLSSSGEQSNGETVAAAISADGRYVGFLSGASNLVPGDTNGAFDYFRTDVVTGQTIRISVSSTGEQADLGVNGGGVAMSGDGRYVAFNSPATNLVPGDTNDSFDTFVRDTLSGQTERVDLSSSGVQADFGGDVGVAISGDGRYVAFDSGAGNLVPGDTNSSTDVFVHDRMTGATQRVSVSSTGAEGEFSSNTPAISADGRYVAFRTDSTTLMPVDTNGWSDVLVHDTVTGQTSRASVSSIGAQARGTSQTPAISADGRYVAFMSLGYNLVAGDTNRVYDVFRRDLGH